MLNFQEKFLLKCLSQNEGKGNLQVITEKYKQSVDLNFNDILNEKNNLPRWINKIRKAHQSLKDKNLITGFELGDWLLTKEGLRITNSLLQIKCNINTLVLYGNEQVVNEILKNKTVAFEITQPFNNSIAELFDYPIQGILVIETKKRLILKISKITLINSCIHLETYDHQLIEEYFDNEGTYADTLEITLKSIIHVFPKELTHEDDEIPPTIDSRIIRRIRDTSMSQSLKKVYTNHCQVCGDTIVTGINDYYSEAHHLKPLGKPHFGPDIISNLIVLCPNHHAEFDAKSISLNPDTLLIEHIYKRNQFINNRLKLSLHTIDIKFIKYHYELFKKNMDNNDS